MLIPVRLSNTAAENFHVWDSGAFGQRGGRDGASQVITPACCSKPSALFQGSAFFLTNRRDNRAEHSRKKL
jgi:hypothetical protein